AQRQLAEAQRRSEQRIEELAEAQRQLAEAQRRSEQRIEELAEAQRQLAEAQRRSEQRIEELAEAQRQLAEAQRRSEQRIEELAEAQRQLAEAQRRSEQRIEELAEAQRRTDERLEHLTEEVRALTESQRRLAETQREMYEEFVLFRNSTERRLDEISRELRNLANRVGMTLEEEAEDMVSWVLQQKGYRFSEGHRSVVYDGEVDIVLLGVTPEGKDMTVVVESKTRLGRNAVFAWRQRVQSEGFRSQMEALGFRPPYLPYFFAMRPDPAAVEAAREVGIGLVTSRGEVVEGKLVIG
ncbi:MAG: YraN family protein, partial [Armatimonadota bacterium]|nr:YraN family protein [Armatimonadota bacterium]